MCFYDLFQSYGLALILFALVIKLVLFPFSLKGKKSMIQMNLLSSKMQQLQKQYGKDRERYNLEIQKLYEKEKVNPMSGCLWSFIPIIFLMVLYGIIREPLTYLMNVPADMIETVAEITGVANSGTVFVTIADCDKEEALPLIRRFYDLGFNIEATEGTARFLKSHGIRTRVRRKISEGSEEILDSIRRGYVSYVINTRDVSSTSSHSDGYEIRRCAVENNVSIFTSLDTVRVLLDVLEEITISISTID